MTKRVYRYFFDFLDGQQAWLNQMASQGWRLVKCGQLSYDFESCDPGQYQYRVEFVADRSYGDSKKYREFLESLGYRAFYKNLNVGLALGKVQWRPWAKGAGQIVTAPGGYFKELLIVEKKADGKEFELHTDLSDQLSLYRRMGNALLWAMGGMLAAAVMCLALAAGVAVNGSPWGAAWCAMAAIPCAVFGCLWIKPFARILRRISQWQEQAKTHDHEPVSRIKSVLGIMLALVMVAALAFGIFWITTSGGGGYNSGSALMLTSQSGRTHWNARYAKLNGFRQRTVSLGEGAHDFAVEITTDSGEIDFSIKGRDGTVYYQGTKLSSATFSVQVDGPVTVVLRVDARSHSGSYRVEWGGEFDE